MRSTAFEIFTIHLDAWLVGDYDLPKFYFEIKHKKGADNHQVDALPRLLTRSSTVTHDDNIMEFYLVREKLLESIHFNYYFRQINIWRR